MPTFTYSARETATGREIRNMVDAASEQAAIAALLNRNLLVLSIQERIGKKGKTKGGKVKLADLVVFTRQLATMVDAGIAIVQSLQALADQSPNKVMRDVIRDVCTRVESGESFSEALQKHPKAFNRLYVAMVSAGEKGGLLAEILARLATYLETTDRLRKKIKTAMMYPTAVTAVAICITIFLLVKVIPVFREIYSSFGAKLPAPTQALINISEFPDALAAVGHHCGCRRRSMAGCITSKPRTAGSSGTPGASSCPSSAPSRTKSASPASRAPSPRSSAAACRFWTCCRLFPRPSATRFWKRPSRPPPPTSSAAKAFPPALAKHPVFPSMIIRMMTAGEQTGNIDTMLERVSDFLDEEIENALSGLMSLIEPLLIVVLGVVIGGMVICMYLPIFNLANIVNMNG